MATVEKRADELKIGDVIVDDGVRLTVEGVNVTRRGVEVYFVSNGTPLPRQVLPAAAPVTVEVP